MFVAGIRVKIFVLRMAQVMMRRFLEREHIVVRTMHCGVVLLLTNQSDRRVEYHRLIRRSRCLASMFDCGLNPFSPDCTEVRNE